MKKIRKAIGRLVGLAMVAGLIALAAPSMVLAAQPGQDTTPPAAQALEARDPWRIERLYQRELRWLDAQSERLTRTSEVIQRVKNRIADLKSKGLDTSALEAAMNDYRDGVQSAQEEHRQAESILTTHAGFDADGKVLDNQQALKTVQDAGQALRGAHQDLRFGVRELLKALGEFRRDNRQQP